MKAKTFDRKFDSGDKIVDRLDLSKALWLAEKLDQPVAAGVG
jgi:hypothetical protein